MSVNKIKIEGLKLKKAVYPGILLLFLMVLAIVLFFTAKFLSGEINRIFESDNESAAGTELGSLDMDNYLLLAKKIGLTVKSAAELRLERDEAEKLLAPAATTGASSTPTEEQIPTPAPAEIATATPTVEIAGKSPEVAEPPKETDLSIYVINSTKKTGLAAGLKKELENTGIPVAGTGNQAKKEALTLLKIRPGIISSKLDAIRGVIAKKYIFEEQTLTADSPYNIEIVIGGN